MHFRLTQPWFCTFTVAASAIKDLLMLMGRASQTNTENGSNYTTFEATTLSYVYHNLRQCHCAVALLSLPNTYEFWHASSPPSHRLTAFRQLSFPHV